MGFCEVDAVILKCHIENAIIADDVALNKLLFLIVSHNTIPESTIFFVCCAFPFHNHDDGISLGTAQTSERGDAKGGFGFVESLSITDQSDDPSKTVVIEELSYNLAYLGLGLTVAW